MEQGKRAVGEVELVVRCDCGFEARGTEDKIVPLVQEHGVKAHKMKVTREQALSMAHPI
jgi:predicted small metal-binding protein